MDAVSNQLLSYQMRPPRSPEELQSRTLYEIVGRHVMAEVNKRLPDVPPPENFPIFAERWTTFVTRNVEAQRHFEALELKRSYETGRRDAMNAHTFFAGGDPIQTVRESHTNAQKDQNWLSAPHRREAEPHALASEAKVINQVLRLCPLEKRQDRRPIPA